MLRLRSKAAILAGGAIVVGGLLTPQLAYADSPSVPLRVCNSSAKQQRFSVQGVNPQEHVVAFPGDRSKRADVGKGKFDDIPGAWKIGTDIFLIHQPVDNSSPEATSRFHIPSNLRSGDSQMVTITYEGPWARKPP